MIKIVLIGMPGSGKSTVGKMVAEKLGLTYISSGDIARSMNTPIGEMADEAAMREQTKSALAMASGNGFIFDGLPRFVEQAKWLYSVVGNYNVFCLAVDSKTAISRLLERSRSDDKCSIIRSRIANYKTITQPILTAISMGEINCNLHIIQIASIAEVSNNIISIIQGGDEMCWYR